MEPLRGLAGIIKNVMIELKFIEIFIIQRFIVGIGMTPSLTRLEYSISANNKVE